MKKLFCKIVLIFFIATSLFAKDVKRNPNVPLENLKIGDKFKISKTTINNETTFDFTGLGLDDSLADKVRLMVYYCYEDYIVVDNDKYGNFNRDRYLYIDINFKDLSGLFSWAVAWMGRKIVFDNVFKQTIKEEPVFKLFDRKINRVIVSLIYYPYGYAFFGLKHSYGYIFNYKFEGFIDGTGEVELVNCYIDTPGASLYLQNKDFSGFPL